MKDRVSKIVTEVRLKLGEISTEVIGSKNYEIYNKANFIQDEIMRETKCNEIEFEIYTIAGQEEYDIKLENANLIKTYETSWLGELTLINNNQWNEYSTTGSNYPLFMNLFDKKLRLRPIPLRDNDTIKIWAYQESVNVPMDADIDPEIPSSADRCLIYGICSEYNEKYYPMYIQLRSELAINVHNKTGMPKQSNLNW